MDGLTEGRIVHFVMPNGEHRPALVVKVWHPNGTANLSVFSDWTNDTHHLPNAFHNPDDIAQGMFWATSVQPDLIDKKPGTWHWIERVEPEAKQPASGHTSGEYSEKVDWYELASHAYNAYGKTTEFKNYQGLPMPVFSELSERIRGAWIAAVREVVKFFNISDSKTGEPFVK